MRRYSRLAGRAHARFMSTLCGSKRSSTAMQAAHDPGGLHTVGLAASSLLSALTQADLRNKPLMSCLQALIATIIADHEMASHKLGCLRVNQEVDYGRPERPFKLGAETGLTLYVNSRKLQRCQVSLRL